MTQDTGGVWLPLDPEPTPGQPPAPEPSGDDGDPGDSRVDGSALAAMTGTAAQRAWALNYATQRVEHINRVAAALTARRDMWRLLHGRLQGGDWLAALEEMRSDRALDMSALEGLVLEPGLRIVDMLFTEERVRAAIEAVEQTEREDTLVVSAACGAGKHNDCAVCRCICHDRAARVEGALSAIVRPDGRMVTVQPQLFGAGIITVGPADGATYEYQWMYTDVAAAAKAALTWLDEWHAYGKSEPDGWTRTNYGAPRGLWRRVGRDGAQEEIRE